MKRMSVCLRILAVLLSDIMCAVVKPDGIVVHKHIGSFLERKPTVPDLKMPRNLMQILRRIS